MIFDDLDSLGSKLSGYDLHFDNPLNIIESDQMEKDSELKLFNKKLRVRVLDGDWQKTNVNKTHNISIPDNDIYMTKRFEVKNCTFYDSVEIGSRIGFILIIVIPIAFFFTVIVFVYFINIIL